jgi:hypothetical protein
MEYLFTYGWALFIVVIVLAILIGTGIFSAGWFTPNECVFQPDFTCSSYILYRTGADTKLEATLHNGLGFGIRIVTIMVKTSNIGEEGEHEWGYSPAPAAGVVPNGGTYELGGPGGIAFLGGSQPVAGASKTVQIAITYVNCGANESFCKGPGYGSPDPNKDYRYITGKITTRIEQK